MTIDLEIQRQKKIIEAATSPPYHTMKRFNGPCAQDGEGFFQICEFNRNMPNWVNDEQFYIQSRTAWPRVLDALEKAVFRLNTVARSMAEERQRSGVYGGQSIYEDTLDEIESILKGEGRGGE
jgi:hypothetical protein